jgi:hypothetical protein
MQNLYRTYICILEISPSGGRYFLVYSKSRDYWQKSRSKKFCVTSQLFILSKHWHCGKDNIICNIYKILLVMISAKELCLGFWFWKEAFRMPAWGLTDLLKIYQPCPPSENPISHPSLLEIIHVSALPVMKILSALSPSQNLICPSPLSGNHTCPPNPHYENHHPFPVLETVFLP